MKIRQEKEATPLDNFRRRGGSGHGGSDDCGHGISRKAQGHQRWLSMSWRGTSCPPVEDPVLTCDKVMEDDAAAPIGPSLKTRGHFMSFYCTYSVKL